MTFVFTNVIHAQSPETIVQWHTLRVTANYSKDLATTKDDELLFVWVGYSDIELFEKLKNQRNTYVKELPGVKAGLLIGKGKILQEVFDASMLNDEKVKDRILTKYGKGLTRLSIEEELLGIKQIIKEPEVIYPTRELVPKQNKQAIAILPGMHKHECGVCGEVWAHYPGGSHTCPNCNAGEWRYQYQGPKPATSIH
jgi:hypothetical protein